MSEPSLADFDPLGECYAWLNSHPRVAAEFGDQGRFVAENEPPYPMGVLIARPGLSDLRWRSSIRLEVRVFGDLDGSVPGPRLWRCMSATLEALRELSEVDHRDPTRSVITSVTGGTGGEVPEPTGQPRWIAEVTITGHPPLQPPA